MKVYGCGTCMCNMGSDNHCTTDRFLVSIRGIEQDRHRTCSDTMIYR